MKKIEVRYCNNCGNEIKKSHKFCQNCGESIKINSGPNLISKTQPIAEKPTDKNIQIIKSFIFGILVIIIFGLIANIQNNVKLKQEAKEAEVEKEKVALVAKEKELSDIKNKLTELENREPQVIIKTVSEITREWSPQVVDIYCYFSYSDGTFANCSTGSGFMVKYTTVKIGVVTNKHVIYNE